MKQISLLGYQIAKDYQFKEIPDRQTIINTINAFSWINANKDNEFKTALQTSDILLPDGIAIVFAAKFLNNDSIKKVAGADLHDMILKTLNETSGKCFYLGAAPETLIKIQNRILQEYPNITVDSYSPPYKETFTQEDNYIMVETINKFKPDVLFVGMTAPKQEKWIHENKSQIKVSVITGIGAVFDFYAGTKKRPNQWMISHGLEWFGRLMHDPKRLWKRYLIYSPQFFFHILKIKFEDILHSFYLHNS